MIETLAFKADFARTAARFEAWWHRAIIDRPPVSLWVQSPPPPAPTVKHRTLRDRWVDVEYNVDQAIAGMERAVYCADTFPVFWPNLGPEITATLFGCDLEFGETTAWSKPVVHEPADWERFLTIQPDFTNPYWRAVEAMTAYAIQRSAGRYVVGLTDLHGTYDTLAGLRDPQALCLDLIDCPDLLRRVGETIASGVVQAFDRNYQLVARAGFGSTTWTPLYHAGPAYVPSCDFWCMVSPSLTRELIWPTVLTEMQPLARSIFHLDGPQALPHLELLLDHPRLNAVQWVYGEGHGPAARWIDVYRRIQAAGKGIQLLAADPADALAVLRQLKPEGVWICVGQPFASVGEAEAFLAEVGRDIAHNP